MCLLDVKVRGEYVKREDAGENESEAVRSDEGRRQVEV